MEVVVVVAVGVVVVVLLPLPLPVLTVHIKCTASIWCCVTVMFWWRAG